VADIKLLHWNIQTWSDKKTSNENADNLVIYVAHVMLKSNANIVSLLELHSPYAEAICKNIRAAIIAITKVSPKKCPWKYVQVPSGVRESYVVFFKEDNFVPWNAGKSDKQIYGLSNVSTVTDPKSTLDFCSTGDRRGGRVPFYISFKTTDTNKKFTVIAYHAMYGDATPYGVLSAGLLGQNKAVNDSGVAVAVDASLPSGDYNVYFDEADLWAYKNLIKLPASYATLEKTSLKAYTPPAGYKNSVCYRSSAYDNIFFYNGKKASDKPIGRVPDLIRESTLPPTGTGLLAAALGRFDRDGIRNSKALGPLPSKTFEDSWHVVRDAISDHLPVMVEVTI
jgi:hypothetical protein